MPEQKSTEVEPERYARQLFELGSDMLLSGRPQLAIETLNESLSSYPTAEAFAHRGWAKATLGDLQAAIGDCHRAIRLDPEYGKAYNDLGAYLLKIGRLDEAREWLEKAKGVLRNDLPHFPYLNLAQIYTLLDEPGKALAEYVGALELDPHNYVAEAGLDKLKLSELISNGV